MYRDVDIDIDIDIDRSCSGPLFRKVHSALKGLSSFQES